MLVTNISNSDYILHLMFKIMASFRCKRLFTVALASFRSQNLLTIQLVEQNVIRVFCPEVAGCTATWDC